MLYQIKEDTIQIRSNTYPLTLKRAYSLDGGYIGDINFAKYICDQLGIKPEKNDPNSNCGTSQIGYCANEDRWYGWSNLGLQSFVTREEALNFVYGRKDNG